MALVKKMALKPLNEPFSGQDILGLARRLISDFAGARLLYSI